MSVVCTFVYILSIIMLSGSVRYSDDDEIFLGDDANYIKVYYVYHFHINMYYFKNICVYIVVLIGSIGRFMI